MTGSQRDNSGLASARGLRRMRQALAAVYLLSGACALTAEVYWMRSFAIHLGGTMLSSALVLSAFVLWTAVGNAAAGACVGVVRRPLAAYGACEVLFGLSALACDAAARWQGLSAGNGMLARAALIAAVTAVPFLCQGAAWPFLADSITERREERTAQAGLLYAANTLGAALGVVLGGVVVPVAWGYQAAFHGACALACGLGVVAVVIAARNAADRDGGARHAPAPAADTPAFPVWSGYVVLAGSGMLSMTLEMLCLHYVRQITAASLFAVAAVLCAFIAGLGIGGACAAWLRRSGRPAQQLLRAALWLSAVALAPYPWFFRMLIQGLGTPRSPGLGLLALLAGSCAALLPALVCVGLVFPLAWETVARGVQRQGRAFGMVFGVNKAAAVAGIWLGPWLLAPLLGSARAWMSVSAGYLALALLTEACAAVRGARSRRAWLPVTLRWVAYALVACGAACVPRAYAPHAGETVLDWAECAEGTVAVTADAATGSRHIVLQHRYQLNGTTTALRAQRQETWLPLLLSRAPRRVLFIGVGSGISACAALDAPIARLDAVELIPDVLQMARAHFAPWNAACFTDARVRLIIDDGRHVVRTAQQPYDVVICDLLLPADEASGLLYSLDFFRDVRAALAPGGVFCLWLPLHLMDRELTRIVMRTFAEAFPCAVMIRGSFDPGQNIAGLVGSRQPIACSAAALATRLAPLTGRTPLLRSPQHALLMMAGDLHAAAPWWQTAPLNTDDHPVFAFRAAAPIGPGRHLRGMMYLQECAAWFPQRNFPSCSVGRAEADELYNSARAGNHYFAAATLAQPLPVPADAAARRVKQSLEHLATAERLAPRARLALLDLGE